MRPVPAPEDVPDVARADEPGPTGHQEAAELATGHVGSAQSVGRSTGGASRPAASSSRASSAARRSDATVPGVRPMPVVDAAEQAAVGHVVVEDVGDLELAAAGGRQVLDDLERIRPQEVDPDRDEVALRDGGLLLEADDAALGVQLGDPEPLRVRDLVEERARAMRPGIELRGDVGEVAAAQDVVAEDAAEGVVADEAAAPARSHGRSRARRAGSDTSGRARSASRRRAARRHRRRSCRPR